MLKQSTRQQEQKAYKQATSYKNANLSEQEQRRFQSDLNRHINHVCDIQELQYRDEQYQNRIKAFANHFYGHGKNQNDVFDHIIKMEELPTTKFGMKKENN